jgi:hypothetical protein
MITFAALHVVSYESLSLSEGVWMETRELFVRHNGDYLARAFLFSD